MRITNSVQIAQADSSVRWTHILEDTLSYVVIQIMIANGDNGASTKQIAGVR